MKEKIYPLNTWYVACYSHEVNSDKPLARTICDVPLVFFRDSNKTVAALEDFCPHRGAPLSLGYVENGKLVCGYHGLVMGREGKTDAMPKQRVDKFPCIKAFKVVEKYGFIWLWPGEQDLADEDALPNLFWADSPDWAYGGGLYHINCDYRLMVDNLMDLTHETYVHSTSIGQSEIEEAPVNTKVEGAQVVTSRFMENIVAPPFWQAALEANDLPKEGSVDRWQVCRFDLPSHIMIEVGVAVAGEGGINAAPDKRAGSIVVDFITPESDQSIHYFWGMARDFKVDDTALTEQIKQQQGAVFAEDQEILEEQQKNLNLYPDRQLLMLDIDSGGVMARRMITRAIKAESR